MNKRFYPLIFTALTVWTGCGFQFYLIHRNQALHQKLQNDMRLLQERSDMVKAQTKRLEELLKLLQATPVPDPKSKL
jgi:hypothetical protein